MERSAEWLRGAVAGSAGTLRSEYYQQLLAEAEAREASGRQAEHDWFYSTLALHTCCRVCGIVQRRDGNNKPCKGPVSISTREASAPTAEEDDDGLHRQIQNQTNIIACHLDFEELLMRELFRDKFGDKSMEDTLKAIVSLKQQLATAEAVISATERALEGVVTFPWNEKCKDALATIAKWKEAQR